MATKKNEIEKFDVANLSLADLSTADIVANVLDQVEDESNAGNLEEMTSQYLSFESYKPGEKFAGIFTRMTTIKNDKGQDVEAVELIDRDLNRWVTSSAVVVGSLRKVENMPCAVLITYKGQVKGANGTYHNVKVEVLKPRG